MTQLIEEIVVCLAWLWLLSKLFVGTLDFYDMIADLIMSTPL